MSPDDRRKFKRRLWSADSSRMEKLLLYLGLGFALLLAVAVVVALCEQLRDDAQLRRVRDEAETQRALLGHLAAREREAPAQRDASPSAACPSVVGQAALAGASRRSARPAVGQPSSGWIETEPMVLSGPSQTHFDPTEAEMSLH